MNCFVTGASGFIGKRPVRKLLDREGSVVYFLTRASELPRLASLYAYWSVADTRAAPIVGDLAEPLLGVAKAEAKKLRNTLGLIPRRRRHLADDRQMGKERLDLGRPHLSRMTLA